VERAGAPKLHHGVEQIDAWRLRRAGGGGGMTFDRLVCASCAAPVSEGRCPVCRANRQRMQQEGPLAGLSPTALIGLLLVLIGTMAFLAHQA
jgi:hypothetical protein